MNERDMELLDQCKIESKNAFGEVIEIGFDAEKFAFFIRADEREVCLTLCRKNFYAHQAYEDIRARGNK